MRILLVEDNETLADWLRRTLRKERYIVDWVGCGGDADFILRYETYDLIILDLALPKMGGRDVLRRMRERGNRTPVLVLTADNSLRSRVNELDQGADDYMAKPFEVEELEARIRVLVRRSSQVVNPVIVFGELQYNTNTREYLLGGEPLSLTPRERSSLEVLTMKIGTAVPKQAIAQSLFSIDEEVSVDAVEIYMHRLRKKLQGSDVTIVHLRGLGYLLRQVHHGP
ncbi:Transcriptional regulatory protein tctD (plasmid) [Variovorax sp. SRS16]|uniref:response regulator n=1 Tax=Variovorax sp. SRS16 TaxID=282217 RepID=UPI001317B702|nr:response regulator [Variovorax sp. SRS16]VTU45933.1 Transcriptional regulatory protein tctD [Variovorax sp. SRS16]